MAPRAALLAITCLYMAWLATAQDFLVVSLVSLYDSESQASIVGADSTATTFDIGCGAQSSCGADSHATLTQGSSMYAYASPTITSGSSVSTAFEVTAAVSCDYDSNSAVCMSSYLDGSSTLDNTITTTMSGDAYPSFTAVTVTAGMGKITGTGGNGTLMSTGTTTSTGTTINYSTVSVGSPPATGSGSGLPSVTVSTTESTSGGSVVTIVTTSTSFMSTPSSGECCSEHVDGRMALTRHRSLNSCRRRKHNRRDTFTKFCGNKFNSISIAGSITGCTLCQGLNTSEFRWWSLCSSDSVAVKLQI